MRRWYYIIASVVLVVLAYAILQKSYRFATERNRPTLSVAANALAVASAPLFVAADPSVGTLQEQGFVYQEIPFTAGRLALDALIGGNVDVATVAETPVVLGSVGRPDLRIIATVAKSQLRLVARKAAGIASGRDLRGKRVAQLPGSSSEFYLRRVLEEAHLSPADVTVFPIQQAPDLVAALRRGEVDAISIWEPHAYRAIQAVGEANALVISSEPLYTEYFNIVTTTGVLRDRLKHAALVEFLGSLELATELIYRDPENAKKVTAARISMDPKDLSAIWEGFKFGVTLEPEGLVQMMERVEVWAADEPKRSARTGDELRRLIDDSLLSQLP